MTTVIALVVGLSVATLVLGRPRTALCLWLGVAAFLPFWQGVSSPVYLPPTALSALIILPACFYRNRWRLNRYDVLACTVVLLAVVSGVSGFARPGDVTNVVTQWFLSFLVARMLVQKTGLEFAYRAVAVIMSLAAVGACIEYFSNWNPYFNWVADNAQYVAWGASQERGGEVRAEWAFGHSIALGCAMAMTIPLAWYSRMSARIKTVCICFLALACILSFSRAGMLTLLLAVSLCLIFGSRAGRGSRTALLMLSVLGGWFLGPRLVNFFQNGAQSNTVSADYRLQLDDLVKYMNPLGLADGYYEPTPGVYFFNGFKSIDSTFIFVGVSFGWLTCLLLILGSVLLCARLISRRSSPADIAVVSVVPALFTVAPITQFGSFLWFVIGIAACAYRMPGKAITAVQSPKSQLSRSTLQVDHREVLS